MPTNDRVSIRDLPLAISVIAAVSLTLSIAFEIGYLLVIDYRLLPLFSVQDAIVGALPFVPVAIVFFVGSVLGVALFVKFDGKEKERKRSQRDRIERWLFLIFGLFLVLTSNLIFFGIFFILCGLTSMMIDRVKRHELLQEHHRQSFQLIVTAVFGAVMAFCAGGIFATADLERTTRNYEIVTDSGLISANLLKSGSEFLLVRTTDDTVTVIPRGQLKKMTVKNVTTPIPWLPLSSIRKYFGAD